MKKITSLYQLFFIIPCLLLWSTVSTAQFYSGSQTQFGKNRMKYEDFFWTYYSYDRYDVYFYEEGKDVANYVSKAVKKQIESVEKLFDYSFDEKIQFICYNKQTDFKQSNIGLGQSEEYNTGGITRIAGSKIILYFEGDHNKLDAQIRSGVAEVLLNQMMYGGKVSEVFKNNTLLNLPDWYTRGLTDYVATDWNSDIDNRVKDGILTGKYKNINRLEGEDALYAGHAFWKHIADNYGEAVFSNILYMTKVSRNIDNSVSFVLGISVKALWKECFDSFTAKYHEKDISKKMPEQNPLLKLKKIKATRVYSQMKVSPDGKYIVYTTNEMGQYKIWLYNVERNKAKRILKSGHKIDRVNDYSFPLLAWHPSSKLFSYIYEKKTREVMTTYEIKNRDRNSRNIFGFEKILDYSYNSDGKKFVMSAVQKGQSDIFVFTAASNAYEQLTKDIYDDMTPRFVHNSKDIVFASNRPTDTLNFDTKKKNPDAQLHKDLFMFNNVTKSRVLTRVTNTPTIDETYPADYDSTHISYLSDLNGIRNRYLATFDSAIAYVDTAAHYRTVVSSFAVSNYPRNILEQDVNLKANKLTEIIYENGKYKMFVEPIVNSSSAAPVLLLNTSYRDYKNRIEKKEQLEIDSKNKNLFDTPTLENVKVIANETKKLDTTEVDINNFVFENEKKKDDKNDQGTKSIGSVNDTAGKYTKPTPDFVLGKQKNYDINYSVDYVVSQLDNSFSNTSYQKFTGGNGPIYLNPGINALFKIGISDLFEDYSIVGALRFSGDLNSNEFFISYENRLHKIDRQLILHRQGLLNVSDNSSVAKIHTHDIRYILKFPFSEVAGIRASISYRNDRVVYLSSNDANLRQPNKYENWGTGKLEYVFDNTIKKGLNLYNGTRAKLFGEYYRQIDKEKTDFFVVGFDARVYKKISRCFIWANRIAGSTSFGNQKLIYYMGGVDNWFGANNPKNFDYTTNIATDQNYAYQTLATNMRGFIQNARNGNSFLVYNSELRLPIFKYLYKRPIRADFIENFQLVAFTDVGTAWTGRSPYDDTNSLNSTVISSPQSSLVITLNVQHNPLIGGYGWGVRTRLFGYFIRIDRAWGVQDGVILKPITYLSLSLDF